MNEQGTPAETRIVAISNLQEAGKTSEDVLRPDLFYRLAALRITMPPLRQRGEDILTLFTRLSEQFAEEYGCEAPQVSAQEAAQLLQAPWPGNVRQLINIAERAVLQSRRGSGTIASLLMSDHEEMQPVMTTEGKPLKEYVEAFERMLIDNYHASSQRLDCFGDGRAVSATPDLERKNGQIWPATFRLPLTNKSGEGILSPDIF